jgi:hypothetical protein
MSNHQSRVNHRGGTANRNSATFDIRKIEQMMKMNSG